MKPRRASKRIEHGAKIEPAARGKRPQSAPRRWSGSPRMARNSSITRRFSARKAVPDFSAACSRKRSAISPTLRPPTVEMPAIARRSSTSARALLLVDAFERGEHARMIAARAIQPAREESRRAFCPAEAARGCSAAIAARDRAHRAERAKSAGVAEPHDERRTARPSAATVSSARPRISASAASRSARPKFRARLENSPGPSSRKRKTGPQ